VRLKTLQNKMPEEKRHRINPTILQRARDLRHPLTPAEHKIWERVRDSQLGYKLRRQHVIGKFIPDFYCAQAKLLIEIDGDTHVEPDQADYDAARTAWLEERGYRVIRFDNRRVHQNLEGVLEVIRNACAAAIETTQKRGEDLEER
jgi:very-short-patch-repair endonuclease